MLGYCTIGVKDMDRATAFYNALLGEVGAKLLGDMGRIKFYGTDGKSTMLAICIPYDEQAQHPGNGNMVSISAGSRDNVDRLHARALELGGADEGGPGVRAASFYGAYARDPEGNKLCFYDFEFPI